MSALANVVEEQCLGAGRSGIVYQAEDEQGREIARKVFAANDRASNLVHYVFTGAPNPYRWNDAAIECAALRRQILHPLLGFWFGDKLTVARAYGHGWNEKAEAWELRCELVSGRHLPLRQPFSSKSDLLSDVRRKVIAPLQTLLIRSGFDGLVWQAGRGNPVALNNFMLLGQDEDPHEDQWKASGRWVWIDLESGVPALIPINPLDLLFFYLPRSVRHGRPLFDDTDIGKLRCYLEAEHAALVECLGADVVSELAVRVDALEQSQDRWRNQPRFQRSIAYRLSRGFISAEEAEYYDSHALSWYAHEAYRAIFLLAGKLKRLPGNILRMIRGVAVWRLITLFFSILMSQAYRAQVAREYVVARSERWQERDQLNPAEKSELCEQLLAQEASSYLTDFGMHIAVKPFVKLIQFGLVPVLLAVSLIGPELAVIIVAFGGAAVRTFYTFLRIVQNAMNGRERPWLALFVGTLPVLGNLAFPLQVVYSSSKQGALVARFILFDSFARFGQIMPIWGGDDTLTEHLLNRLPTLLPPLRNKTN